jgi:hypothetical protein
MKRIDILFRTNRFNLSRAGEHFINPCCFGEDVTSWLRPKPIEQGIEVSRVGQEDWGWYLFASNRASRYLVGFGGNSDGHRPMRTEANGDSGLKEGARSGSESAASEKSRRTTGWSRLSNKFFFQSRQSVTFAENNELL